MNWCRKSLCSLFLRNHYIMKKSSIKSISFRSIRKAGSMIVETTASTASTADAFAAKSDTNRTCSWVDNTSKTYALELSSNKTFYLLESLELLLLLFVFALSPICKENTNTMIEIINHKPITNANLVHICKLRVVSLRTFYLKMFGNATTPQYLRL